MSAVEALNYVQKQGKPQISHVVAAVVTNVPEPNRQAANDSPDKLQEETQTNHDIMMEVEHAKNFIFSGKEMYTPPEMRQKIMEEIAEHAETFKRERTQNPALCISNLKAKIGAGSAFARKHKQHVDLHHPAHPDTHEPHADHLGHDKHSETPKTQVNASDREHKGALEIASEHHHGEYMGNPIG